MGQLGTVRSFAGFFNYIFPSDCAVPIEGISDETLVESLQYRSDAGASSEVDSSYAFRVFASELCALG